MTTTIARVDQIDGEDGHKTVGAPGATTATAIQWGKATSCASYKTAKYLAASQRRDGTDSYAYYDTAQLCWSVKGEMLPAQAHAGAQA